MAKKGRLNKHNGQVHASTWVPTAEELAMISRCVALGFTQVKIAQILGVRSEFISIRKKEDDDFAQVFTAAKAKSEYKLAQMMMDNALDERIPFDMRRADVKYLLDKKHGWQKNETSGGSSGSEPPTFTKVTKRTPQDDNDNTDGE